MIYDEWNKYYYYYCLQLLDTPTCGIVRYMWYCLLLFLSCVISYDSIVWIIKLIKYCRQLGLEERDYAKRVYRQTGVLRNGIKRNWISIILYTHIHANRNAHQQTDINATARTLFPSSPHTDTEAHTHTQTLSFSNMHVRQNNLSKCMIIEIIYQNACSHSDKHSRTTIHTLNLTTTSDIFSFFSCMSICHEPSSPSNRIWVN